MALTSITKDFVVRSGALTEGTAFVSSSTGQTSTLQVNGGAAIAKNLIVGTTATVWGAQTNHGSLTVNGLTTLAGLNSQVTTATSLQVTGASLFQGQTLFTGSVNTFSGALFVTGTNILTVDTGATTLGGTLTVAGVTNITNTTTGNFVGNTGALIVAGGTVVGDNLIVKSTAYNTATNTANAIYTPGGIYADQGLTVAGPVLFKDVVTFNGTATYVLSTNTYYTDNILEIHTPPGGVYSDWFVDDGKDIGFRFHYYTNSTDTNAALVLDNATKELHWYSSGAEATNGDFSTATYGTFRTGNVGLDSGVAATNTLSGALQILNGGAGIGGAVWANTLNATNLTTSSGIVYSINNKLQNTPVTWNDSTQRLVGTIDRANTSTNVQGGAAGSLIYQTAESQTTTLPIGSNGQILVVTGGNPTWAAVSGLSAGTANTASNIAGGLKDQIPYQSGPGQTVFNAGLRFNGTTFTTTNIVVSGNGNSTGYNNGTGALQVAGGVAINNDLWVGGDINLQGSLYLKGVGLDQITGSTGTFDFLIVEGTGTSLTVSDGSTFGGITTVTNVAPSLGAVGTAALQVRGGVGIAKDIYVGTTATIAGSASVGNSLIVTGYSDLNGGATISAATVTNTLNVTGYSGLNGGASVTAMTVTNTLNVTGYTSLNGGATISAATVTNTLNVTGYSGLNGGATISAATVTNNLLVSGNTQHTGYTSINGGATANALTVTNEVTVGTTLSVTGYTSLNGGATISAATVTNTLNVTGYTSLNGGATISAATVTNTLNVTGYSGLNGGASVTAMTVTNSTAVATTGTGALIVPFGGVGIGGGLVVGGITTTTNTSPALGVAGIASVQVFGGVGIAKDLYVGTTATIAGITYHNTTTPSLGSATSGAIQTTGGVGIAKDLYVGTTATIGGTITAQTFIGNFQGTLTGTASKLDTVAQPASGTYFPTFVNANNATANSMTVFTTSSLTINPGTGAVSVGGNLTVTSAGTAYFQNVTDSNAPNNGSVIVSGGVGIAKAATIGTTLTVGSASSATTVNSLYSNNYLISSYTSGFVTTNSLINLDTYSATSYRTCKYVVQIVDGTKIHVEEILLFHDGTNVYITEYAVLTSQGELGTFDAAISAGTVTLNFTANYTPTNMTIKTMRTAITL
jgi:fibronectin-binding autotransporter adhesin